MATISSLANGGTGHANRGNRRVPYLVEAYIDLADAATAKGSALAQGDVIEAINVPAGTFILGAGLQLIDDMTGTSTDATINFGVTGVNASAYVAGWDIDAAAELSFATPATTAHEPRLITTADTIDMLIVTQTGTITGGVVRAFAWLMDVAYLSDRPNIAQRQS